MFFYIAHGVHVWWMTLIVDVSTQNNLHLGHYCICRRILRIFYEKSLTVDLSKIHE